MSPMRTDISTNLSDSVETSIGREWHPKTTVLAAMDVLADEIVDRWLPC